MAHPLPLAPSHPRGGRAAGWVPAAVTLLLLAVPGVARAHLGHVVTRAERYLKLDASPDGLRLVVSLTLGPGEAMRVLSAADADHDSTVTQAEADSYMAQWGDGLRNDLPVTIDGEPVEVRWGEPFMDPIGPIRPLPGNVEMVAHVALPGGVHRVQVLDHMRVSSFDRTDVAFQARDGAHLKASGAGESPTGVVAALAYGPGNPPSVLTADFELPETPEEVPLTALVAGGALILLGLGAWLVIARRRAKG